MTRFEWMVANDVDVVGWPEGTVIGADVVERGNAVVLTTRISLDDDPPFALVIEGTPAELHALARRILSAALAAGDPVVDVLTGQEITDHEVQ